ncbi:DsbA family oxidoreductase [Oxalobacteraceae bacterium OM1]|nr:DsbA family oxidoreductase [Oxalobacteraceae bacterium OM1]
MAGTTDAQYLIDVWSDYVCPFCYLELPLLQQLKRELGDRLEITWHPFELRPDPEPVLDPDGPYLHNVWTDLVYPLAQERGMHLKLPPLQPRSRKAFEAAEHARVNGRFDAMHEGIFKAFFVDGRDIEDIEVLVDIGADAGLDMDDLKGLLDAGRYERRILDAEQEAADIGITAVPLMVLRKPRWRLSDGRVLRGAVGMEDIRRGLKMLEMNT